MAPYEWIALAYFAAIAAAARRSPRRSRGLLFAAAAAASVIVARFALPSEARAWLPHAWLVLGYWIPALFTPVPLDPRFEAWLRRADALLNSQLPNSNSQRFRIVEIAYLLCYPMVPASFAVVFFLGSAEDVTRYWVAVLLAAYACYGTLPWTAARPPRLLSSDDPAPRGIARLNAAVLGRVSHNFNTFPSGHVAVSLAAALSVIPVHRDAGIVFLALAAAIAIAAVGGRYHYLVDVLAGLPLGALGWIIASL